MTEEQRKSTIEISKRLCLSCVYKTSIDEYYLIRQANGGKDPMLFCKALSARACYDKITGECSCTTYERKQ